MRNDDLSRIVQYASQQKSPRTSVLFVLVTAAGVSPVTYIKPSYEDTPPYHLPDDSAIKTLQVISTWLPTTALLYLACLDFMNTRRQYLVPPELQDILEGLTPQEIRRQDWGIGIISALSAIPLTTPLVKFPLVDTGNPKIDVPSNIVLVSGILTANGIAHLRPLQVIIHNPWYGAPITVTQFFIRQWKERSMTLEEKKNQELFVKKTQNSKTLNSYLTQTVLAKKSQLIDDCFVRKIYRFEIKLSNEFNEIYDLNDSVLIKKLAKYKYSSADEKKPSTTRKEEAYHFFLHAVSQIGAALALGISVGYLADSGFELSDNVFNNDIAGWTVAVVPIWAFGVLIHNAARVSTFENIDFAIGFAQGKRTLSWPLKYCAGIYFGLLLVPSVALMLLNASAASVMFRVDFEDYCSDDFIDSYLAVFRWGYVWLANLLMLDIERYIFTQWAANFGTEEAKRIAHFDARVNNIVAELSKWKGDSLQNWLADQPPASRKKLLNISTEEYQKLSSKADGVQELIEKKEAKIEYKSPPSTSQQPSQTLSDWFSSFFKRPRSSSFDYQELKEPSDAKLSLQSEPQSSGWSAIFCWKRRPPRTKTPTLPPNQEMGKKT